MALRNMTLVGVLALLLVSPVTTLAQEAEATPDQQEAIGVAKAAAKEWLVLLDARDFTRTWEQAGKMLRGSVDLRRWQRRMSVTLGPMGKVASRAVRSAEYSTTLPAVPEGEYVVIKYDTSFENGQTALEEVVMMKESDGTWKVAGYRIQ